jgi:hypothetical protein
MTFNLTSFRSIPVISLLVLLTACGSLKDQAPQPRARWSAEQANEWQSRQPWLVGCNFIPSSAINQLEMWQADTWDPATIDRELGWAQDLGFTSVRVFLHDLVWRDDPKGLLQRMDQFLAMAQRHRIGVMFVLLDAVWDPFPKAGKQRAPRPHTHNSGWVQSPGADILKDPARHGELESYFKGVIGHFRNDRRIQVWDLFNEPDNPVPQYRSIELTNKAEMALAVLKQSFTWARAVNPSQPLTSGVWIGNWADQAKLTPTERCQLEESDVITFHTYSKLDEVQRCVNNLRRYGRPILCTEYLARPRGSHFDPILGYFKEQQVGAYNWGFVNGKSQTIYPWDSWEKKYTAEPSPWFHDIFRQDGTPYDLREVQYIKSLTRAKRASRQTQWPVKPAGAEEPAVFAGH